MRRTVLVLGIALAHSPLGCVANNWPEISGEATLAIDGRELTLTTKSEGDEMVRYGDAWGVDCEMEGGALRVALSAFMKKEEGFHRIVLHAEPTGERSIPMVTVNALVNGVLYDGACPTSYERTQEEPFRATVSAEACDLRGGAPGTSARLVGASFHVQYCFFIR